MAKFRQLQTNFTAGVLDPKLAAREDITFYYNGLKDGNNIVIIPQGGVVARPALQFIKEVPPVLQKIDLSGAAVSAPQGGTPANLTDGDSATAVTTSGNLGTTNPFVVAHVDLVTPQAVTAVDVIDYYLSSLALSGEFFVQYSDDDVVWSSFGSPFDWDMSKRSRRLRGSGAPVTARYWRIVRIGTTDIAAQASISEVVFWEETAVLSNGRLIPFAYSTEQAYMFAVTDRNIDVLKGRDYHGSISIPHLSSQIPIVNFTQSLDTMILYHKAVAPFRIFRQGGDDEFDFRPLEFYNIPQYDYGAGTGGVDEVQTLNDAGGLSSGDDFTLVLEGNRTKTITAGGSRAATAAAIQSALRALQNTSATGISVADDGGSGFSVTFGGEDGKKAWLELLPSVMTGIAVLSVSRTIKGQAPGEDIMSDTRGWPRAGAFHQSRHHLGGISGVPDAWLASVLGDYFNFDTEIDTDEKALLFRAESDQVGAIYDILVGKHLTFFTNDGEFYVPTTKIDDEAYPKWTTDAGSKEGLKARRVQGDIVFVQGVKDEDDPAREIASSLQRLSYDDTVTGYRNNLISKLSGHLIRNPVDFDLRKSKKTDENDLLFLINSDGTAVAGTILQEDNVNALTPLSLRPDEKFLAVAVDKQRRVYFMTERMINNVPRRFIEVFNDNIYLDCGAVRAMTFENIMAAADGQDEFIYSFASPASADEIGLRINGVRQPPEHYSVDLGTKILTLVPAIAAGVRTGDVIRIAVLEDTVSGLEYLEGEVVQSFIDGTPGEDCLVSGGAVTLSQAADTEIQIGFDFDVSFSLMPFRIPEEQTLSAKKIRVINLILNLIDTIGVDVQVNGGDWRPLALQKTDTDVLDRSALELLYTGEFEEENFAGSAVGAPVTVRRGLPGPFTCLGITREVQL